MKNICKTCGSQLYRKGNYNVCEFCGNKWRLESVEDSDAIERANAWVMLKNGDFEKAEELFENILANNNSDYEAHWGKALAGNGIIYVTDLNENKKVPTCNNITENSFLEDKDFKKALSIAPVEIKDNYKSQAEQIESIRIEWLEKARKEPAYDIFISYKDSDRENNIERTQDSIDAQDLYNLLESRGYKVFFSRISLRNKVSEQYEPYIYNAINTAKIMIVFGEKSEYFNSVWIKNEWSRYIKRIERGEKHKNSLVVVYKNLDPTELPIVLRNRQCMNMSELSFSSDLHEHIKHIIEDAEKSSHLDRIKIVGGQMSEKATQLKNERIKVRKIGEITSNDISIEEKEYIELISKYIEYEHWDDALLTTKNVLLNNPNCAEAKWYKFLAESKVKNPRVIISKVVNLREIEGICKSIQEVLDCAKKEFAERLLVELYCCVPILDLVYARILKMIIPYSFENRKKCINEAFKSVIEKKYYNSFKVLLTTLEPEQVDTYIDYNMKYAINCDKLVSLEEKVECLKNIIQVDSGNIYARKTLLLIKLKHNTNHIVEDIVNEFEQLLKYVHNIDEYVDIVVRCLAESAITSLHFEFSKQAVRYYINPENYLESIKNLIKRLIEQGEFDVAKYILDYFSSINLREASFYWYTCMIKMNAKNEQDIINSDLLLNDIPEYIKCLTMLSGDKVMQYTDIKNKQKTNIEYKKSLWKECVYLIGAKTNDNGEIIEFSDNTRLLRKLPQFSDLMSISGEPKIQFYWSQARKQEQYLKDVLTKQRRDIMEYLSYKKTQLLLFQFVVVLVAILIGMLCGASMTLLITFAIIVFVIAKATVKKEIYRIEYLFKDSLESIDEFLQIK